MPAFDQTGPQGMGPNTGRGFGPCGNRRGLGCGRGFGRGIGKYFGWNAPATKEEKTKDLQSYRDALKEELEDIEKQLHA